MNGGAPLDGPHPGRRWDRASVLFGLVWAWAVLPKLLQTLTAPKYRTKIDQEAPPLTAVTAAGTNLLTLALLLWCVFVILEALRDNPRRNPLGLLVLLLPWVFLEVRNWQLTVPLRLADLLYPLPVIAVWLLRPGLKQLRLLGYLAGLVAVLSVLIAILLPDKGVFRSIDGTVITEEKNLLPWGMLVGIFTHGNTLGQFLVIGIALIALIANRGHRNALLVITLTALVWTSARSTLYAAAALAAFVLLLSVLPPRLRGAPVRIILLVTFGMVALLPLVTHDPVAFTNRGFIWGASLNAWRLHPLVGNGSHYFSDLARTSADLGGTVYHGHNEFMQLMVIGGVVLAVLVGVMVLTAVEKAGRGAERSLFAFAFLFSVAGASLLEVSLTFVDNTFLFPVLLLPLATIVLGAPLSTARGAVDVDPGTALGPLRAGRARA